MLFWVKINPLHIFSQVQQRCCFFSNQFPYKLKNWKYISAYNRTFAKTNIKMSIPQGLLVWDKVSFNKCHEIEIELKVDINLKEIYLYLSMSFVGKLF